MSFILDALRRADAERERERGQLPDLHARSLSARAVPDAAAGGLAWPRVVAALVVLLLVGLVGWLLLRTSAPVAQQAAAPGTSLPDQAPTQTPTQAPAPTPAPTPVPALPQSTTPPPTLAVAPQVSTAAPAPVARAETPVHTAAPPIAPPRVPATAAPAPRPAAPPEATMPALKVGGVMYAETPESRVLVINDQVLREGESVQPGLMLEHIGPKSAQLRWKGQLVEVPY